MQLQKIIGAILLNTVYSIHELKVIGALEFNQFYFTRVQYFLLDRPINNVSKSCLN